MSYSWQNHPASLYVEIDTDWPKDILSAISKVAKDNGVTKEIEGMEIKINFLSTGYYDEGKYTGPWEDCYPEEKEDERTPECAILYINTIDNIELDKALGELIFDLNEDEIAEIELEV